MAHTHQRLRDTRSSSVQTARQQAASVPQASRRSLDEVAQSFFSSGWNNTSSSGNSSDTPSSSGDLPASALGAASGTSDEPRSSTPSRLSTQQTDKHVHASKSSTAHARRPLSTGALSDASGQIADGSNQLIAEDGHVALERRRRRPTRPQAQESVLTRVIERFSTKRSADQATPRIQRRSELHPASVSHNHDNQSSFEALQPQTSVQNGDGVANSKPVRQRMEAQPSSTISQIPDDAYPEARGLASGAASSFMQVSAGARDMRQASDDFPEEGALTTNNGGRPKTALPEQASRVRVHPNQPIASDTFHQAQAHQPDRSMVTADYQAPVSAVATQDTKADAQTSDVRASLAAGAQRVMGQTRRVSQAATKQAGSTGKKGAQALAHGVQQLRVRYRALAERKAAQRRPGEFHIGIFGLQTIVLGGLLIFLVMMLYGPCRTYYQEYRAQQRLESKYTQLNAYRNELEAEVKNLQTPEGIEDAAREELGMVREGEQSARVTGTDVGAEEENRKMMRNIRGTAPVTWWSQILDVILRTGDTSVDPAPTESGSQEKQLTPLAQETDDASSQGSGQAG